MSKQTEPVMSVRRDGCRVVIEQIEVSNNRAEILSASYLDAEAAIRIGRYVVQLGEAALVTGMNLHAWD